MFPPYPLLPHGPWPRIHRAPDAAQAAGNGTLATGAGRRVVLSVAVSVDGYLARRDGAIDWLPRPNSSGEDYGCEAFLATVDTLIMGRRTYEQVLALGAWPYGDKRTHVFSTTRYSGGPEGVEFVDCDIAAFVRELKSGPGTGSIWLVGGAEIIAACLGGGVVDELVLTVVPVLLGEGISLFPTRGWATALRHRHTRAFPDGLVQHTYALLNADHTARGRPTETLPGGAHPRNARAESNRRGEPLPDAVLAARGFCAWGLHEESV